MLVTEVIREAASEHEIYFLLTAYVEAVRHCDPLSCLPEEVRTLPLSGEEDVRARSERLSRMLDSSPGLARSMWPVAAEALDIFSAAAQRLQSMHGAPAHPALEAA
jgi:hypothetical protein